MTDHATILKQEIRTARLAIQRIEALLDRAIPEIPEVPQWNSKFFDAFWALYPKKVGKPAAEKAWRGHRCDTQHQAVMDRLARHLRTEWRGKELQYIPNPATYLNQERWKDPTLNASGRIRREMTDEEILKAAAR